jgi:REP element-mobilizing transposase RayT
MPTQRELSGRPTSPRLATFSYRGPYRYFVTIKTARGQEVFTGDWPYAETTVILSRAAACSGFDVLAYCFMPDHVHLFVEGSDEADLIKFVRDFKQRTAYAYKKATGGTLWQRSYYDRILRADEATQTVACYIWNNPVRKGLAASALEYAFIGSFVVAVADWF